MKRTRIPAGVFILCLTLAACALHPASKDNPVSSIPGKAADLALRMQGSPYRYGGTSPGGFDCSGLVYYSYLHAGFKVPRNTRGQRRHSRPISRKNLRRGDLLFFNQNGGRASHVAIYLGKDRFIHAPSTGKRVSTARLTDPYWRRHFNGARRFDIE